MDIPASRLISALVALFLSTVAGAQFVQQGPPTTSGGGCVGAAAALSGDQTSIIASAPCSSTPALAYVFTGSGGVWTQPASLTPIDAVGANGTETSVAINSDATTAVLGIVGDNSFAGAVWVFTRTGSTWTQQGPKLVGSSAAGAQNGASVAISSDGNTIIEGASHAGVAWVYTRTGGVWTGTPLSGTGLVNAGTQVGLSSDGNTALVVGRSSTDSHVAAWIFTRSGGAWTQQGGTLTVTGASTTCGTCPVTELSGAVSGDGNTVIIGTTSDQFYPSTAEGFPASSAGAAWVFTRSGGVWTQQGSKLLPQDSTSFRYFASAASLSSDGNVAVVSSHAGGGTTWTFTRTGSTWSQLGTALTPTRVVPGFGAGSSASMAPGGRLFVLGGAGNPEGSFWVFAWPSGATADVGVANTGPISASSGSVAHFTLSVTNGGSIAASNVTVTDRFNDDPWSGVMTFSSATPSQGSCSGGTAAVTCSLGTIAAGGSATVDVAFSIASCPVKTGASTTAYVATGTIDSNSANNSSAAAISITDAGAPLPQTAYVEAQERCTSGLPLSDDGNTMLMGNPCAGLTSDVTAPGAAYVYTRGSGGGWSLQATLAGTDHVANSQQGTSVSLSLDGNTAIIGGKNDRTQATAWVFTRNAAVWSAGTKLTAALPDGENRTYVAISGDGATAMISAASSVWFFVRQGTGWTQQAAFSSATIGSTSIRSVALSGTGDVAAAGDEGDSSFTGATWVFTRTGGTWSGPVKLTGSSSASAHLGASVALSADGNTLAAGGPFGDSSAGATWVFTRSGGSWNQQAKLHGASCNGPQQMQGFSVSLSADGNALVAGGPLEAVGAAWLFRRSGGSWSDAGRLRGGPASQTQSEGHVVAISGDGSTVAIDDSGHIKGAAWVFGSSAGGSADLAVSATSDTLNPAAPGTDVRWTIRVTNNGSAMAVGVTVNDTLPPGVTLISTTPTQGTCTGTTAIVCSVGALAAGGTATITLVVRPAPASSSAAIVDTATVSAANADPNVHNNAASVTLIPVVLVPALDDLGLALLAIALAALAMWTMRRS
jgi:uncharacterized repeat protein (TIGR01451 family)